MKAAGAFNGLPRELRIHKAKKEGLPPDVAAPPRCRLYNSHHSRQCLEPIVNILSGLILGDAVPLLDLAFQLVTTSIDDVEVVVGEIAPFLFDLALHLFPVSFNAIPIHEIPPVSLPQ